MQNFLQNLNNVQQLLSSLQNKGDNFAAFNEVLNILCNMADESCQIIVEFLTNDETNANIDISEEAKMDQIEKVHRRVKRYKRLVHADNFAIQKLIEKLHEACQMKLNLKTDTSNDQIMEKIVNDEDNIMEETVSGILKMNDTEKINVGPKENVCFAEQEAFSTTLQNDNDLKKDERSIDNQIDEICYTENENYTASEDEVFQKLPSEVKNGENFKFNEHNFEYETDLNVLLETAKDKDSQYQLSALERSFKLILGVKNKDIELEFLPILVECLHIENNKNESQIIHIITEICRRHVDAILMLITMLTEKNIETKKSVIQIFRIIITRKLKNCDKWFEIGFLRTFIDLAKEEDQTLASDAAEVILEICRSVRKPFPKELVQQVLPILDLELQKDEFNVLKNTFKTIYHLYGTNTENIPLFNEYKFIEKILSYFNHSDTGIKNFAIVTIFIIADDTEVQTKAVIDAGAVPMLLPLLESSDEKIKSFIFEMFEKIVKKSVEFRDACIENGLVQKLLKILESDPATSQLHDIMALTENVCQSFRYPISLKTTILLLPLIKKYINHRNIKICRKVIAIIFHILNKRDYEMNQFLINNEIIKEIIPFLHHSDEKIQLLTIRAINALIFGCIEQVNYVISLKVMKYMDVLLIHKNEIIQENALLFIRKVITKPNRHLQIVIHSKFIPLIIELFQHPNAKIQKESIWTISQCFMVTKAKQMNEFFSLDFIPSFCSFLDSTDIFLIKIVLKGINAVLQKSAKQKTQIRQKIIDCGAAEKIDAFMKNENEDIRSISSTIMKNYFTVRGSAHIGNLITKKSFMPF